MKKVNSKIKIVFLGTPEFGAIILRKLAKTNYKPVLAITSSDKPKGRKRTLTPPPVKLIAQKYNIPIWQTDKISSLKPQISKLRPDLIIVASYGQIIPKEVLKIPKYRSLNVHPSLLPRWRGPSPIQFTILKGDKKTGVTIILMDEKIDHGPIIAQEELEIKNPKINYLELHDQLANLGADLLIKTIPDWISGKIKTKEQSKKGITYSKILEKEDGKIDWRKSAEEIERQIRAFYPWPGTYTEIENGKPKLLKILKADVLPIKTKKKKGEIFVYNEKITVQTGKNCLILEKLQLEGKKPINSDDFLRGHRDIIGSILK